MSQLIRYSNRLFGQFSRKALLQPKLNYSGQAIKPNDIKLSRKKKYIYTAFIAASTIGFAYYVKKEKYYGKYQLILMLMGKKYEVTIERFHPQH